MAKSVSKFIIAVLQEVTKSNALSLNLPIHKVTGLLYFWNSTVPFSQNFVFSLPYLMTLNFYFKH